MMDKVTKALYSALKQALSVPGEHRLFRSGKLPGMFSSRSSTDREAAEMGRRDGLLEIVRSETKGDKRYDWVKTTPAAVDFVYENQSPLEALRDLQHVLQSTKMSMPVWFADVQAKFTQAMTDATAEMQRASDRINALCDRVDMALTRIAEERADLPAELVSRVPWADEAMTFLNRRVENEPNVPCTLSELFLAVRRENPQLDLPTFHAGLRQLSDRALIRLLPHHSEGAPPEPEYALLDGLETLHYAIPSNAAA